MKPISIKTPVRNCGTSIVKQRYTPKQIRTYSQSHTSHNQHEHKHTQSKQEQTVKTTLENSHLFTNDPRKKELIDSMIRVDHAGEFGAQRIYEGQLAVFQGKPIYEVIKEMADQETKHLNYFEKLAQERRVRPTVLHPVWNVVGFAVGAGSALLGKEAAMALTVAVEDVISEHYDSQLRTLNDEGFVNAPEDKELREIIKECRDEELEHLNTGIKYDAEQAPLYQGFTAAVRAGTRLAVWLSTRV